MSAKNPNNSDIIKEIKMIHDSIKGLDTRLSSIETWRIATNAAKEAIQEYKVQENKGGNGLNKELLKALGLALTAIVSLIALVQASK